MLDKTESYMHLLRLWLLSKGESGDLATMNWERRRYLVNSFEADLASAATDLPDYVKADLVNT